MAQLLALCNLFKNSSQNLLLKLFSVQTAQFQSAKILDHCAQAQKRIATRNQWHQLYLVASSTKPNILPYTVCVSVHQCICQYVRQTVRQYVRLSALFDIRSKFQQLQTCNESLLHLCPSSCNSLKLLLNISLIVNADNYLILIVCRKIVNKIKFQKYIMFSICCY